MAESSVSEKSFSLENKSLSIEDAYTSVAYPKGPLLLVWTERAENLVRRNDASPSLSCDLLLSDLSILLSMPGASAKMGLGAKSQVLHAAVDLSARAQMPDGLYAALYEFAREAGSPILSADKQSGLDSRVIEKYLSGLVWLAIAKNVPAESAGVPASEIRTKFVEHLMVCSETIAQHNPGLLFSSSTIPFVDRLARLLASESRNENDMALKTHAVRVLSGLYSALQPQTVPKEAKLPPKAEELGEYTIGDLTGALEEAFLEKAQKASQKKVEDLKSQIRHLAIKIQDLKEKLAELRDDELKAAIEMSKDTSGPFGGASYTYAYRLQQFANKRRGIEQNIKTDTQSLHSCEESLNSIRYETGASKPAKLKYSSEPLCVAIITCFAREKVNSGAKEPRGVELPNIDFLLRYVERCYNYIQKSDLQEFGIQSPSYERASRFRHDAPETQTPAAPFSKEQGSEILRIYQLLYMHAIDTDAPLAKLFTRANYPKQLFEPVAPSEAKNPMQERAIECVEGGLFKNYGQTKALLEQLVSDHATLNAAERASHSKTMSMLMKNPVFAMSESQTPALKSIDAEKQVLGGKSIYAAKPGDKIDLNSIPGWKPKQDSNKDLSRPKFVPIGGRW